MNHHRYNNKYSTQLLMYAIFFILGFILGCNMGCGKGNSGKVKVVSVNKVIKDSSTQAPQPINIEVIEGDRIPELASSKPFIVTKTDTLWIFERGEVDTLEILKDYFAKVIYKDTLHTKYGNITVWDTVTRNRIEGRKFLADLNVPSEIIYVTQESQIKKRNEVYFSMGGLYNMNSLSVGPGLLFKTKRDRIYNVNAYLGTDGMITYNFQTAFKIRLKK